MNNSDNIIKKIDSMNVSDDKKENLKNSALQSLKSDVPVILSMRELSDVLGIKYDEILYFVFNKGYYSFGISKKSGGKRIISMPNEKLKEIQIQIKEKILDRISIDECANGFVKRKSIITNAKIHLNQEKILNIDLKDFFPSIHNNRVYYIFKYICGYNNYISFCLTKLVTYKNSLPQGAPTSPVISNIVAYKLDYRLVGLAKKLNIKYTRYADDLTFSGDKATINNYLLNYITNIVNDCGFNINTNKTRFAGTNRRQEVTGLVLNDGKLNVTKSYYKKIRQELYFINKYGIKSHREKVGFKNLYYRDHLLGKILFVKSVNDKKGNELLEQFNKINW